MGKFRKGDARRRSASRSEQKRDVGN